ncbi:MAG: RNA methyltransferase [Bdellovibrionaceae bacterium]|nr:RNA methyltransferase [Pseudobdellovibrionaceae bacterium]
MRIKKIESNTNSIFKELSTLLTAKGIKKSQKCLMSGEKIIAEHIARQKENNKESFFIYHREEHSLFSLYPAHQLILLPQHLYAELDVVGTHAPLLCAFTSEIKSWNHKSPSSKREILCALGDPSNLGALIRSAKAFGFEDIVLLKESANPFLPKALKASSGLSLDMHFYEGPSIQELSSEDTSLFALDMHGEPLESFSPPSSLRLLIGQEGLGVPQTLSFQRLAISMDSGVESLNATIAASIALYQISMSRKKL